MALRIYISQKFTGDAILPVWGPHFESLIFRQRKEGAEEDQSNGSQTLVDVKTPGELGKNIKAQTGFNYKDRASGLLCLFVF